MRSEGESTDLAQPGEGFAVESPLVAAVDPPASLGEPAPHVFVSYRRSDAAAQAFLLHDRLKQRFGQDNVFLDVDALKSGMDWRKVIHARANAAGVLIVLIGQKWLRLMQESAQRSLVEPIDDVARQELELALTSKGSIDVLPVLVDGAAMPAAHDLPTTLQRLTDRQAERLELETYDDDVERLMDRLVALAKGHPLASRENIQPDQPPPPPSRVGGGSHVARLAEWITGTGHVVVVLGPGVNRGLEALPDSERLAATLAGQFGYHAHSEHAHLSEVAQYVDITCGRPDLHTTLTQSLNTNYRPGPVHRFVAELQGKLESMKKQRRPFMALTTNFDTALERAFDDVGEPYHLAIYMAGTGKFLHIAPDGTKREVSEPNTYSGFPIEDDLRLNCTLLVKLHGAIGQRQLSSTDGRDYVISEDNYIDYLSGRAVEQIVPVQVLEKLKKSHCVFLGYDIADWSLRVLLKRVWGSEFESSSWAVHPNAQEFESRLWRKFGLDVIPEPIEEFAADLEAALRQE